MKLPEFKMDRLGLVVVIIFAVFSVIEFAITVNSWMASDCPDAVVTTDLLDEVRDSLVARGGVATAWFDPVFIDSIAKLNGKIDSLVHNPSEVAYQLATRWFDLVYADSIVVLNERLLGTVSIAAVDSLYAKRWNSFPLEEQSRRNTLMNLGEWEDLKEQFKQARGL